MKAMMQYVASVMFVLAGIALLCAPAHGQAFVPTRFTVVDAGTVGKPDVVLVPGLASSRAVWDAEAKLLAPNFRLHLVQVNGFAGAPAGPNATGDAMLPAIVDELHGYIATLPTKPVVMGHSMGGLLALMLAQKYPMDARKLVIVDSLPFYGQVFDANATVDSIKPTADAMAAQIKAMPADQYAAMQPMFVAQMVTDPNGQKLVAASSTATDRGVMVEAMHEDMLTDVRPGMAGIKVPVLMLFAGYDGTSDRAKSYEATVREDYKPVPNVTVVKVENSKHFIMYDQPAKMDAAIEGFLK